MKVPFTLRRLEEMQPAEAFLVFSDAPADVLRVCVQVGGDPLPPIYRVAGGFLVKRSVGGRADRAEMSLIGHPACSYRTTIPGAIALRSLAANLFLPADAALAPALRDDEAAALVRTRGLVLLPGGRILAFDPAQPVRLAQLVGGVTVERQAWQALPRPRALAERIRSITIDRPDETPELILEAGGEDIGTEAPRPADSSFPTKLLGQAALGAGKMVFNLGSLLGLKGLANIGAGLMAKAMALAPRLSESLLGRQEAALRELLRKFREGKLEEALRRALPLGGEGGVGGTPYTGQELPTHSSNYSLGSLLGGGNVAPSIWYGGHDVQAELAKEYRRAAEEAIKRGDFRRAAFIYGKLLNDYRMAANVLMQGCRFHDAGMIYLTRLNDRRAAARAFESAGEVDRAVELYRMIGEHVLAGDALRRAGEEEAAVLEYREAAERMAATGNYLGAGDVMANSAKQPLLAKDYFQLGWERRPDATSVSCGLRLARLFTEQAACEPLLALVSEARAFFAEPGDEVGAEQFFNELALLAEQPKVADVRDDLRDHALLGLAIKLRQRTAVEARPGPAVSKLFGRQALWSAPLVTDADHAFRAAFQVKDRARTPRPSTRVRLGVGRVTAICHAPASGEVFVGFLSGDVVCYRPATSETLSVKSGDGMHVLSLATSSHGDLLCVLQTNGRLRLRSYARALGGSYRMVDHSEETMEAGKAWLTPLLTGTDYTYAMLERDELVIRHVISNQRDRPVIHLPSADLDAAMLVSAQHESQLGTALLLFHSGAVIGYPLVETEQYPVSAPFGWTPARRPDSSLLVPPLSWLLHGNDLELTGLTSEGVLNWSRLHFFDGRLEVVARTTADHPGGYLAAAMVRPSLVAGVARDRIELLRAGSGRFTLLDQTPLSLPQAVACFSSSATSELLVVCQDGMLERMPMPPL